MKSLVDVMINLSLKTPTNFNTNSKKILFRDIQRP